MATINLGKVKGEPFRYEDFTHEQLEALKGKDFKYEDFSPEQLDKLKSKVKIGTVETLDADQEATVTSSVDGNVTTLNIGIPRGNGVNSYSGTREEYEDIAETIKDGSLVNITDENDFDDENLIGQVTMQRLNDIEDNFDNIKPHALTNPTNNLLATEPGTPLDAVQGKVLNDLISRMQNLLPLMQVASYGDDDFNNHPVNKIVQVGKSSGILNGPLGATSFYGMSTIIKSYFGYGYQLAVKVGSDAAISGVYIRFNDAKNWGAWKTLVTETELNNILNSNYSIKTYASWDSIGISSLNDIIDITTIVKKIPKPGILEVGVNMADREILLNKDIIPIAQTGTIKFINVGRVRIEYYPEESHSFYLRFASNYNNQPTSYSPWKLYSATEVN